VSDVSVLKFSFVLMMLLVFASQFYVSVTIAQVSESEASSALTSAEGAVDSAYQAVLRAEEAGANVSGLLVRLNDAGELLAKAKVAYRLGDFDEAARFANLSGNIGGEVQNAAVELKDSAWVASVQRRWFTMTGSIISVVGVVFGSFWGWSFFRRRYYRRVLGMKPEVAPDES